MLDLVDERSVIEDAWQATAQRVEFTPEIEATFLSLKGPLQSHYDNRRKFHRFYLRGKALLTRGHDQYGVYTKDISRQGMGFLAPIQLFPKERVVVRMPNGSVYELEVARCRRAECDYFECGTRFAVEADADPNS